MESTGEKDLCARVLSDQPGAAEEFYERCHAVVLRTLEARCLDGRSRSEAADIVDDVFADCFRVRGEQNLLRDYSGRVPLANWLGMVAHNRLKNWWRSGRYTYERQTLGEEGGSVARFAATEPMQGPGDHEVYEMLGDALLAACRGIKPRDLAILRAFYLQGLRRNEIAVRWGCSPATIGRRLKRTVAAIREALERYLGEQESGLSVTWEDLLQAGEVFPELLVGFDARGAALSRGCRVHGRMGAPREAGCGAGPKRNE